ncbi:hypothetical protein P7C73_g2274, partial [Tremellales sp. Uapishka_1]
MNPVSKPTEFFGPIGCFGVTVFTPLIAYLLFYGCNEASGCPPRSLAFTIADYPSIAGQFWDWKAFAVYLGWYAYVVVCWIVLPGEKVEGTLMRDGHRKTYTMNGFYTCLLTLGLSLGIVLQPNGPQVFTYLYDHWVPLVSASLVVSVVQAVWVYAYSFASGELLALGGNSGSFFYDASGVSRICQQHAYAHPQFFLGRPLNPTVPGFPSFDIKTFNEVRPGMLLWLVLNISCACEQYVRFGRVTDSMWVVLVTEGFYVVDCLYQEATILTQMDITTDGFGFMLAFGDLTWVPFTYGLQARFLAFHPVDLGIPATAGIVALNLVGNYIFRVSNGDKNEFRKGNNPKGAA